MDKSLDGVLDSFIDLVKPLSPKDPTDTWIRRHEDGSFGLLEYHGVVESIYNKFAAIIVIAKDKNGLPVIPQETWSGEGVALARVFLLVSNLRPSINESKYSKETSMYDVLQEGETAVVQIKQCFPHPENIFLYFAVTGYKLTCKINEGTLSAIRDPLRGVVDTVINQEVGLISFETYDGRVLKAIFSCRNLYLKGKRIEKGRTLSSLTAENTLVFLEVNKWYTHEIREKWEKDLYKEGVVFHARTVWLKDDPRPSKNDGREMSRTTESSNVHTVPVEAALVDNVRRSTSPSVDERQPTNYSEIYCGRVESFTSCISAVICTAHRNGTPLAWKDNWCEEGVCLERVFLLVNHIRPSENQPEYGKGTNIRVVLKIGEPLKMVIDPTNKVNYKCYKWFVKTCWKIDTEEAEVSTIPITALPGHLNGVIESLINNTMGIINFKTYHGMYAKALFTCNSYYKDGKKLNHLPLGSVTTEGTEVFLVVDKRKPKHHNNDLDQELFQNQVHYRATLVWNKGSSKPDEEESTVAKESQSDCSVSTKTSVSFVRGRGAFTNRRPYGRIGQRSWSRGTYRGSLHTRDHGDFSDSDSFKCGDSGMQVKSCLKAINKGVNKCIRGTIISVDENWGLVKADDESVFHFPSNVVFLYGLKIEGLPLQHILHCGQVIQFSLEGENVKVLEYGLPQGHVQMRNAVLTYCEKNVVPNKIRDSLVDLMQSLHENGT